MNRPPDNRDATAENSFVPGSYWTRERADAAIAAMVAELATPTMQTLMEGIAEASAAGTEAAAAAAAMTPVPGDQAHASGTGGTIDLSACVTRRGRMDDVPALAQLIVHGELPPLFIEPFVEGFCVVEHRGQLVACGGLELYGGECAVIRSVVSHESARGIGLGARVGRLLIDDARAYGATDLYLFTMHAVGFWEHLGFHHLEMSKWRPEAQPSWQYMFCARFPDAIEGVHSMWMPA